MSKLSCEGIGEMVVTLPAADGVAGGQVVTLGEDGQVAACASGQRPCGVALEPRGGCAAVQVGGFARVACSDSTVKPGFVTLCGDGKGQPGEPSCVAACPNRALVYVESEGC